MYAPVPFAETFISLPFKVTSLLLINNNGSDVEFNVPATL